MPHPSQGYRLLDGTRVPGTTTIIGRYKESGALLWWAFGQGKAAERGEINSLYDKRDEAADIGTCVHEMVEAHVGGKPVPDLADWEADKRQAIQSGYDAYMAWERMTRLEITHQEIQLVCPEYRFGGTPDAIGLIEGEPCLLDWKTSKSVYEDMLVQLAAYGHLVLNGLQQEHDYKPLGIRVKGFHLCKFSKEHGDFSHHYYPDLSEAWEQFKDYRRCYDRSKILKARAA